MNNKAINEIKVNVESRQINYSVISNLMDSLLRNYTHELETLNDIKCATMEAVSNSLSHAYCGEIGPIYISVKVFANGKIRVKVEDKGCGIENVEKAREPLYTTGNEEHSGLGFSVMESFSDNVKVKSTVGKGTTVIIEKTIELYN